MLKLSDELRIMRLADTVGRLYDGGTPTMEVYEGIAPESVGGVISGSLVATLQAVSPHDEVTTTSYDLKFEEGVVLRNATPSFAIVKAGSGARMLLFSVGEVGGDAPVTYNTSNFYEGGLLRVNSLLLQE